MAARAEKLSTRKRQSKGRLKSSKAHQASKKRIRDSKITFAEDLRGIDFGASTGCLIEDLLSAVEKLDARHARIITAWLGLDQNQQGYRQITEKEGANPDFVSFVCAELVRVLASQQGWIISAGKMAKGIFAEAKAPTTLVDLEKDHWWFRDGPRHPRAFAATLTAICGRKIHVIKYRGKPSLSCFSWPEWTNARWDASRLPPIGRWRMPAAPDADKKAEDKPATVSRLKAVLSRMDRRTARIVSMRLGLNGKAVSLEAIARSEGLKPEAARFLISNFIMEAIREVKP